MRAGLRRLGVDRGDRVAAYLPNIPETYVLLLATASLGAVCSSCAPEFGTRSVLDRWQQIEPKVLVAVDGYRYGDKPVDRRAEVAAIRAALPVACVTPVEHRLPRPDERAPDGALPGPSWPADTDEPLTFEPVPFDHPLYVLYSSGTTGLPKPIVHGHGGILLEHLKMLALHHDLGPGDRFFWFTTTGWMMWNFLVSGLAVGAAIVLFDGDPGLRPTSAPCGALAEEAGVTYFGTSAPFLLACRKAGLEPAGRRRPVARCAASARPARRCPPRASAGSTSTVGTDAAAPLALRRHRRVHRLRRRRARCCRCGRARSPAGAWAPRSRPFDADGRPVDRRAGRAGDHRADAVDAGRLLERPGRQPLPGGLLRRLPGRVAPRRLDHHRRAGRLRDHRPLRRHAQPGRRPARHREFYSVVEGLDEVADSLVVHLEDAEGGAGELLLFVVLGRGLAARRRAARADRPRAADRRCRPGTCPTRSTSVRAVPRTLSAKKLEVPVKRILTGTPVETAAAKGALANPDSLAAFEEAGAGSGLSAATR